MATPSKRHITRQIPRFLRHAFCLGHRKVAGMIHKACGYRELDYLELKLRFRSVML